MCNSNCGCGREGYEGQEFRGGCREEYNYCGENDFADVARIAREVMYRRQGENRCARQFVNCMRRYGYGNGNGCNRPCRPCRPCHTCGGNNGCNRCE